MHRLEDFLSRGLPGMLLGWLKSSRLFTAGGWKALRLWQDITGSAPNAFTQLQGMQPAPPGGSGPRILVPSLRGWTAHLAWESTLSRALHLRGARTLTILCDRTLPACEPRTVGNDFSSTCDRCTAVSRGFMERTGLPFRWLGDVLPGDAVERARERVAGRGLAELRSLEDEGVPVGRLVEPSVNRHLLAGGGDDGDPAYREAYRRFAQAGLVAAEGWRLLLDDFRPDVVFELNGLFYAEAILARLARERGITVWAYERGKRLDSLIFARDQPVVRQDFREEWAERRDVPLRPGQAEALDAYLDSREAGNVGIERLWAERTEAEGSDGDRPTAVLFTNVLWDTAMFDSDVAFGSMAEWIARTVGWFRDRPDHDLVIRVHPAEVRVPFKRSRDPVVERIRREVGEVPANVRVVGPGEPVDSYGLVDRADVVLAYASTIGLEAALKGVPTVVAGRTHYRDKGFTWDARTPEEHDEALRRAFDEGLPSPDALELARRYAWLYFFQEILPFEAVRESPRSYVTFRYRTNEELAPGRDEVLDAICDALLTGGDLTNPAAR